MKTIVKESGKKGILLTFVLLSLSVCAKAQGSSNFFTKIYDNMLKDGQASIFIIAGVLGIGLIAFFALKIANKEKGDEKSDRPTNRPTSHRHHHHHRVIKKSA